MYKIDHRAFARFGAEQYGILGGITLTRVRRRLQANGMYNIKSGDLAQCTTFLRERDGAEYVHHHIRVEGNRSAAGVAESLAHELKHAQQAEKIMRETDEQDFILPIRRYFKTGGYWSRPCEVEAREAGRQLGCPLRKACFR